VLHRIALPVVSEWCWRMIASRNQGCLEHSAIALARPLLCRVERKRAVEFARGTEICWYDRGDELRLVIVEEVRSCELSK
jgi:hypothetical protein